MKSDTIYIIGEISDSSFISFRKKVIRRKTKAIDVVLMSEGGDAYAALAYYDFIRNSNIDFRIHATGLVASAAVIILAAGDHRSMSKNAWIMVHEDQVAFEETSRVTQLEKDIKHARRLEVQWDRILFEATGVSVDVWDKLHKNETYLDADECKKLRLIDEVK